MENVNIEKIKSRIQDIEGAKKELKRFKKLSKEEFLSHKDNYAITSYYLRIAIEAVLTIGTHILSRLPSNGKKKDYTQVIMSLSDQGVIPEEFAGRIKGMAGYRNRLVHLYWAVEAEELLSVVKENLDDLNEFIDHIKKFIEK